MAPTSMLSHCAVEALMPPGSTKACRYMIMPVWVQISKCPTHNCSLMAAISRCTSARRGVGIFMSKAQARCSAFISAGVLERPVMIARDVFDHRERIVPGIDNAFEQGHAVSTLPLQIQIRW